MLKCFGHLLRMSYKRLVKRVGKGRVKDKKRHQYRRGSKFEIITIFVDQRCDTSLKKGEGDKETSDAVCIKVCYVDILKVILEIELS